MSKYEKLMSMKYTLADLHKQMNVLKKELPSEENAAAIVAAEKLANEIKAAIRVFSRSNGIAA